MTRLLMLMVLLGVLLAGCARSEPTGCLVSDDCFVGELCRFGRCVLVLKDGEVASDVEPEGGDGVGATPAPERWEGGEPEPVGVGVAPSAPDMREEFVPDIGAVDPLEPVEPTAPAEPMEPVEPAEVDNSPCADAVAPAPGMLVINELLVNVPTGDDGDANGDGVRDAFDDEFVELVNVSDELVDMTGVKIANKESVKLEFSDLCLGPGGAIVVFSGPRDQPARWLDDVYVMRASSRLGFSNSAGLVELLDPHARTLFAVSYEDSSPTSYVLYPELTGEAFVRHDTIAGLFSPGTCADGRPLSSGCVLVDAGADMGGD